jgi:REP element-mobilizing transposase RayT
MKKGKAAAQLELDVKPRTWGGKREGAGRPRKKGSVPRNVRRPELRKGCPIHVTLRVVKAVGRLRRPAAYAAIQRAVAACLGRDDFRIVHTSIQGNHLHLIVEADDKRALGNGMRAFMISAAQHLNTARGRRGTVFPARYHAVQLTTPKQVRAALAYVLNNWRRHQEDLEGPRQRAAQVDPYSTAILFDGWKELPARFEIPIGYEPLRASGARTWLLTVGWRKHHPLIGLREVPGPCDAQTTLRSLRATAGGSGVRSRCRRARASAWA